MLWECEEACRRDPRTDLTALLPDALGLAEPELRISGKDPMRMPDLLELALALRWTRSRAPPADG